ncbi:MAG: hypothetical protein ABIJ09_01545 [Pseudomonadota bacterium]
MRLLIASALLLTLLACKASSEASSEPFADDFSAGQLGPHWNFQGGSWKVRDGALVTTGDQNVALWLDWAMPRDVEIRFDATSSSPAVDLKCELFGDGRSHESGYIIINGGWNNSASIIARQREHELDQVPFDSVPYKRRAGLTSGHTYQWRIVRQGNVITQFLDGEKYLERDDPEGLYGPDNNRFAFNNWAAQIRFDNLRITPLDAVR